MGKFLTTFGPRILGGVVSWLAGIVYVKSKGMVTIDPAQVVQIGTVMIGSYAATHRIASRAVNPGDAAKARLADAEKQAVDTGTVVKPQPPSTATYVPPARNDL